jgi:hypothetical protein
MHKLRGFVKMNGRSSLLNMQKRYRFADLSKRMTKAASPNVDNFDSMIEQHCLADSEILNVAINYSIVKSNEMKSLNEHNDVGTENLTINPIIDNLMMS